MFLDFVVVVGVESTCSALASLSANVLQKEYVPAEVVDESTPDGVVFMHWGISHTST